MPSLGRDRLAVAEQVLQHRGRGAFWMRPLAHLGQLLGVAEQDDVPSGGREGERVGERDLTRLVDEQVVEALIGAVEAVVPSSAGGEVELGVEDLVVVVDRADQRCSSFDS